MKNYVIALDQGTSSSRAIVFDRNGVPLAVRQKEFTQHFPEPGMVEHDPMEIWATESSVMMEAATGKPVCNAIVWQDRRTSAYCDSLKSAGLTEKIREKTGLIIDAYFSGTKIRWILENVPGAREKAEKGELRFGTVDSWLVWNLTGGRTHITGEMPRHILEEAYYGSVLSILGDEAILQGKTLYMEDEYKI